MSDLPLSRPLQVSDVPAEGLEFEILPSEEERKALAAFNEDVISIESFAAKLHVTPLGRNGLRARGRLEAATTRSCSVTLEPFNENVAEDIDVRFVPGASPDDLRDDAPEPLEGGEVDLGVIVGEFFTLGLDPYPRKPGVVFDPPSDEAPESPFAVLKALAKDGSQRDS
ncbi:YceD family protein [Hansschlegelia quercus]|uniref:DUF177 domain-containing protein n=1 Tax=Hansschlegelia quercus TaxID=2528245 RepID=A0A4V2JE98_9HYPH|nr:YceD family protein [Hansschlegelia quercus]TBN54406.1 DUF177 domain-containing protein [Hansschlegelia quercus]